MRTVSWRRCLTSSQDPCGQMVRSCAVFFVFSSFFFSFTFYLLFLFFGFSRCLIILVWNRRRTILHKRISATKNATSVPDDVFHRAKGAELYQSQSYKCEPAYFPNSPSLGSFSSSIISERVPIPPAARVICERHRISLVPVTRVVMGKGNRSFMFYIIGLSREVYLKDYPATKCMGCCGLCTIS